MKKSKLIPLMTVAALATTSGVGFADDSVLATLPSDVPIVVENSIEIPSDTVITPVSDSSSAIPEVTETVAELEPVAAVPDDSPIILPSEGEVEPKADPVNPETPSTVEEPAKSDEKQLSEEVDGHIISPVETETGVTVLGTQGGLVIIQNEDGSQSAVSAESIGATINEDHTISVTTKDGKLQTLPHTGENNGIVLALTGLLLIGFAALWGIIKKRKNQKEQ